MAYKIPEIKIQTKGNRTTQYLTGLLNAAGFLSAVEKISREGKLCDYASFYFNLKGFGNLSKRYGHKEGDELIKRYAKALRQYIEKDEILGHLGEDNFIALIKKSRRQGFIDFLSDVEVVAVAGKDWEQVWISAYIGIWDIVSEPADLREVISRPSIALSQAKNITHQTVVTVSDNMVTKATEHREILEDFHRAIEHEEFVVYYQPKVDSRDKKLVGAEGLVRWKKNGKMIPPDKFIPPLEQTGEILLLDYYILQRVCFDIRKWMNSGLEPVRVSVNFSRKDLVDRDLADSIYSIITESGVDKDLIEVEITETIDDSEHGVLIDFINKLYKMGIRTAIDDFGAGYSSLSTLREFQVHTLKIDRSFINTEDFSWKDEVILSDIIHMAHRLGINVITEGVEREDQLAFVNNAGCYDIQGFYFDKPLPEKEFRKRLENKQYK